MGEARLKYVHQIILNYRRFSNYVSPWDQSLYMYQTGTKACNMSFKPSLRSARAAMPYLKSIYMNFTSQFRLLSNRNSSHGVFANQCWKCSW